MNSCSAMERYRLPTHATIWLYLKSIVPSERSQTWNTAYYMIPFYNILKNGNTQGQYRSVVAMPIAQWSALWQKDVKGPELYSGSN